MQGNIYPMAKRNDTNPTVVCEMLCAVNKWKTRGIFIFYQTAEDSQRIKHAMVFRFITCHTVYIWLLCQSSLKHSGPKKVNKSHFLSKCLWKASLFDNYLFHFMTYMKYPNVCRSSCYIYKYFVKMCLTGSEKCSWKVRGWGISDTMSNCSVCLHCVLYL